MLPTELLRPNEPRCEKTGLQGFRPGAEVIKLFSCSTQLSMKFKLLINIEIVKIDGIFRLNSLEPAIYPANKCLNANNCWHFNIYEQDKFHAQLS